MNKYVVAAALWLLFSILLFIYVRDRSGPNKLNHRLIIYFMLLCIGLMLLALGA